MPVGGICCGTLYLGGDGRLKVWDIFNKNQLGAVNKVLPIKLEAFKIKEINNVHGSLYLEPAIDAYSPQQGFAIRIKNKGGTVIKRLHWDDWDEIIFEANYPVANIQYVDEKSSLRVTLQACSPFIPGDAYNSGLPVTTQTISLQNVSSETIQVDIIGWLENKMLLNSENQNSNFTRINNSINNEGCTGVVLACTTQNQDLEKAADYGNMAFVTLAKKPMIVPDVLATKDLAFPINDFVKPTNNSPVSAIQTSFTLSPAQKGNADFIIC